MTSKEYPHLTKPERKATRRELLQMLESARADRDYWQSIARDMSKALGVAVNHYCAAVERNIGLQRVLGLK